MTLVHRTTGSGLVVAEEAVGEAWLSRALKEIDPRLALQVRGGMYVVVCCVNDYYAPVICGWHDEYGNPLPPSSGLLEKVKSLHVGARNKPVDVDEHNRRHLEAVQKQTDSDLETLREEHRPYITRDRVQVTFADVSKPRYWRREGKRPQSGASR